MNIQDANHVVGALNQIAELVTALAADVEQSGWDSFEDHAGMSGARPIPAAQLAQSALQQANTEAVAAPQLTQSTSEPQPDPELEPVSEPAVTLEEVRGVLAGLSSQGYTAQVRELIVEAGADRLSAVDPARYGWLLARAKELSDGSN